MELSSLLFIFIFLPVFLILFYVLPFNIWRNSVLVVASLVFFAWTDLKQLPLLIGSLLFNYILALTIEQYTSQRKPANARAFMWIAVVVNILVLVFYKYTGFLVQTVADLAKVTIEYEPKDPPLGISFLTFSSVSYILDVYHASEKAEKNIVRFFSYLIMFPKLLSGPITRFGQVKNELLKTRPATDEVLDGIRRFIGGLAKKTLLADPINFATTKVFNNSFDSLGAGAAWFGLIGYTLVIYLDFSGYTDMAIGLGKMIGFKLPENFNFPYISRSITDFWRRWHMTLTAWFRNYLFIPLEFARKRDKFLRQQSDILIVFLLTGLWHGANWNYIIWGVYFGIILAIEASGFGKVLKKLPVFLQHFYTIALVMLSWIFFRFTDIKTWGPFLKSLFGKNGWTTDITLRNLNVLSYIPVFILGVIFCLPLFHNLEKKVPQGGIIPRLVLDLVYLVLFVVSIAYILANGFSVFIYPQF